MFRKRRRPVLRIDRLKGDRREPVGRPPGDEGSEQPESARYSFSIDPQTQYSLTRWEDVGPVLRSVGSKTDRAAVKFWRSVDGREISVEVLGTASLDRMFVRWSDAGLDTKSTPPWYFVSSSQTGPMARVPLGEVPAGFDDLSPDEYARFPGLDVAAVPAEAVMTAEQAEQAVQWFLAAWPDDSSPVLDWI